MHSKDLSEKIDYIDKEYTARLEKLMELKEEAQKKVAELDNEIKEVEIKKEALESDKKLLNME